jgi:hypothetical protein
VIVFAMIERKTKRAKLFTINNRKRETLEKLIFENSVQNSIIYTDDYDEY